MLHLSTTDEVEKWLGDGAPVPATILGLDVRDLDGRFTGVGLKGCNVIGCRIGPILSGRIHADGAGLVGELHALPPVLPAFAPGIYTVADLYDGMADDGTGWNRTPDYAGFAFFNVKKNVPRILGPAEIVAARLHDTMQEQAVRRFLEGRNVVAIMGGHDFKRRLEDGDIKAGKQDVYWDCVFIAKTLTEKGFLILSGGGPGVMEAANLGALLAGANAEVVERVRALLANHGFESPEWRATAIAARQVILGDWRAEPSEARFSLGIPTWLYGHEPPNLFASHHSKMFFNSLREDGLVSLANSGIVYFEGNAGTVQEVFQDATQNYYLGEGQSPTPMIFYNAGGYWERPCGELSWPTDMPADKRKPLMPLVKQLAIEKKFVNAVLVTRNRDTVVTFVEEARTANVRTADVRLGNVRSPIA